MRALVPPLVALVLAAPSPAQKAGAIERRGPHFVVQFHGGALAESLAQRLTAAALAAAESTWPAVERLLLARAGAPAVIHVYADEGEFRAREKEFASSQRMRDFVVRLPEQEAHVFLMGLIPDDLDRVGLPEQARVGVVLSAAQLLAAQKSTAAAADPWLAAVFAYAVLEGKQALQPTYGVDPVFDSRRWTHALVEKHATLRTWVTSVTPPTDLDAVEYAEEGKCIAAQLFAGAGADWARKLLANPSKPGQPMVELRLAAVERVLGADWTKNQARWQKTIEPMRVPFHMLNPVVVAKDGRWQLVGSPERASTLDATKDLPAPPYRVAGVFELTKGDEDGARLQLDWDGKSLVGLFLRQGEVHVAIYEPGKPWATLVVGKAAIAYGRRFEVVVEVGRESGILSLAVDGEPCLRWPYGARTMNHMWSIAKSEYPVYVEALRTEPIPAK